MSIPNPIVLLDARARYVHPAFQMTRASTKTVFDATGKLVTVPANALGWDHDLATGQARGYLAEPQATNLLLHSNDLTQGAWTKIRVTPEPDAIIGPDGNGMDKIVASTEDGLHYVWQTISHSSAGRVSCSFLCAPGGFTGVFTEILGGNAHIWYTLEGDGGAQVSSGAPVDYGIARVGDFYRVWFVFETVDDSNTFRIGLLSGGSREFAGDGTSGVYVGCVQAEAGAYPTSYIETGGATATRSEDFLRVTDLQEHPWWLSTRGTLVLDVDVRSNNFDYNAMLMSISNELRFSSGGTRLALHGTLAADLIHMTSPAPHGRYRMAATWDDKEATGAQGGALMGQTELSAPLSTNPTLSLGTNASSGFSSNSIIHRAVYYPQRISNADLQSLTAIQE